MPYASVDLSEYVVQNIPGRREIPVVVHCPTNRRNKGTPRIIDAVNYLHSQGVMFTFNLVEGVSRAAVKEALNQADLVIDQVLCGWYGALAVEAMALGKPVMCYIDHNHSCRMPVQMLDEIPLLMVYPEHICSDLNWWLTKGRANLAMMGEKSRVWVEKYHDPLKIAARLKRDYEEVLG
jgi:hypothetical protein